MGGEGLPPYPTIPTPTRHKKSNLINLLQKTSPILVHPLPRRAYPRHMVSLARLRKEPALAQYFAFVNPFFWPVLIWQLARAVDQVRAAGRQRAMLRVMWWGGVTIEYLGDAPANPSAYKPAEPQRKTWDDPSWSSDLPAIFNADDAHRLFFPRTCGGSANPLKRLLRSLTKGACTLAAHADTS